MVGGVHGRRACVARGACMAGGHAWLGACVAGETVIAAVGTHATGMHSCYVCIFCTALRRGFHKLSAIQQCQYCQLCFSCAIRNEQEQ